jgi:CBS domain-containing protein
VEAAVDSLVKVPHVVRSGDDLRTAAGELSRSADHGPVVVVDDGTVVGLLTIGDVLKAYGERMSDHTEDEASILLRRRRLKVLVQGKQLFHKVVGRD